MTAFYVDTSAIVKRYVTEVGSGWITVLAQPLAGNVIVTARLTGVEVCSALARLQRLKQLSIADGSRLRAEFLFHMDTEYIMVSLADDILVQARDLVAKYPLRALDATQLACAIDASITLGEPLTFLSADTDLLNAARGEGFTTDNPLAHP